QRAGPPSGGCKGRSSLRSAVEAREGRLELVDEVAAKQGWGGGYEVRLGRCVDQVACSSREIGYQRSRHGSCVALPLRAADWLRATILPESAPCGESVVA